MSVSGPGIVVTVAGLGPPVGLVTAGVVMGLLGRRVSRTLVVFVALGPPIGFLTFVLLSLVLEIQPETLIVSGVFALPMGGDVSQGLSFVLSGFSLFIWNCLVSYFVAIAPAAVSGRLVAVVRRKRSQYELVWVTSIGVLVGIAYSLVVAFLDELTLWNSVAKALTFLAFEVWIETSFWALTLACLVSTLACWAILCRMAASGRLAPQSRENRSDAPDERGAAGEGAYSAGLMRVGAAGPSVMRTLGVFLALGPAIGHLTFVAAVSLFALEQLLVKTIVSGIPRFLGPGGFLASYALGAVPAVLSGGLVAWLYRMQTRHELLWVAAIGLLVAIAYTYLWFLILWPLVSKAFLFGLTLACLVSTLICWAITRHINELKGTPA